MSRLHVTFVALVQLSCVISNDSVAALCSYQYTIQPNPMFVFNPTVCSCNLEVVCAATVPLRAINTTTFKWYMSSDGLPEGPAKLVSLEHNKYSLTEKKFDDFIISRLLIQQVNETDSDTYFRCKIDDSSREDENALKTSSWIHLVSNASVSNNCCTTSSTDVHFRWMSTCADVMSGANSGNSWPIVISCVVTTVCIVIFVLTLAVFCRFFKKKDKFKYESNLPSYDIYREPSEICSEVSFIEKYQQVPDTTRVIQSPPEGNVVIA